ncbi:MAG: CBO0543 family protein [Ectobacillus sp.]
MGKLVLRGLLISGLLALPFAFKKKPIKDWMLVYLLTANLSAIIDAVLVEKKMLSYPIRLFPKEFRFHIVFDLLLCPLVAIIYNQFTYKDKSVFGMMWKLLLFTIPQIFIEIVAGRYLNMVRWQKGWKWYHTFITMNVKYLFIRAFIGLVRKVSKKQGDGPNC